METAIIVNATAATTAFTTFGRFKGCDLGNGRDTKWSSRGELR